MCFVWHFVCICVVFCVYCVEFPVALLGCMGVGKLLFFSPKGVQSSSAATHNCYQVSYLLGI